MNDLPARRPASEVTTRAAADSITSVLGQRTVSVSWEPPELQDVVSVLGNVVLDYRDADFPPGATGIDCAVYLGNVEVRLPDDVELEISGTVFLGQVETKGEMAPREPGEERPLVYIAVSGWMGNVLVRLC